MVKKKTHEEYEIDVLRVHGDKISVIGTYEGANKKTKHKCNTCEHEWSVMPNNILRGTGCSKCSSDSQKKTDKKYVEEVYKVHGDKISVTGTYKTAIIKIKHRCNTCEHEWSVIPNSILSGSGCPKCKLLMMIDKFKKTNKSYIKEVYEVHGNKISVIDTYEVSYKKTKHKCNTCEHEWSVMPRDILSGKGCPECSGNKKRTHEEYKIDLSQVHGDKISVIGTYKCNKTKTKHKCNTCEHEWSVMPTNVLRGKGCPKCNESKGEKLINSILESCNVKFGSQVTFKDIGFEKRKLLRCDFVVYRDEKPMFVIEYNGIQHYKPICFFGGEEGYKKTKERDLIKRSMLNELGIPVIDIPYTETEEKIKSTIEYYIDTLIKKEHEFKAYAQI